jgi:CRISPR-associated protein (TIGR02710 family)
MTTNARRAIVLTVGTGNVDQVTETLLEPLKKSIRQGTWDKVILLPSQVTTEVAALLAQEMPGVPVDIRPLLAPGMEDDPDACFSHFDKVFEELNAAGFEEILADFTRGTKAMSGALILAATRYDPTRLRYITGPRDERGMVLPGREVVSDIPVTIVAARKYLDQAWHFVVRGNFVAAVELFPDTAMTRWPGELAEYAQKIRSLAGFLAAWDRLDYRAAVANPPPNVYEIPTAWKDLSPDEQIREWVERLADPFPATHRDRAEWLRRLVADLWANGLRRVSHAQYEDAILRAYRVLELVGQIRLFEHGLDSGSLPPDHPAVTKLQNKLRKGKSEGLSVGRDGRLLASREQVARLLKILGDPMAQDLIDLGQAGAVKPSARNLSVLIHGFQASPVDDVQALRDLYARLESLLKSDTGSRAELYLRNAQFLNFAARGVRRAHALRHAAGSDGPQPG